MPFYKQIETFKAIAFKKCKAVCNLKWKITELLYFTFLDVAVFCQSFDIDVAVAVLYRWNILYKEQDR